MKILNVSAASENSGAGIAALLTHNALIKSGIESRLLYIKSNNALQTNGIKQYENCFYKTLIRKAVTNLDKLALYFYPNRNKELFSISILGLKHVNSPDFIWADIIHLHWVNHGFLNISEITKWQKPVVWTIRDMWPLTGGCHYSYNCFNYKVGCGNCDHLKSNFKYDISYYLNKRKKYYFSSTKIKWVAISSWLAKVASDSEILRNAEFDIIYSGIDSEKFNLVSKGDARERLNLPVDCIILLIGATDIKDKYKGYEYILDLVNQLNGNIVIVSFGNGVLDKKVIKHRVIEFGFVSDNQLLNFLYNSADLFLAPSISEAFGKTFAEAQCSGLPVLCFDNTGPMDIVEHRVTGYLAEYLSKDDLKNGYNFLINSELDRSYISKRAKSLFDIDVIIDNYIKLYNNILND
jgi:glycosyltransferase involved in cell wall biosynthesis